MQSNYIPFLCAAGLVISIIPLSMLAYWLTKKGWMSVRLIALALFLMISSIGIVLWFFARDERILFLMLGLAILGGLSVLSWPITNPSLMKLLKIKW